MSINLCLFSVLIFIKPVAPWVAIFNIIQDTFRCWFMKLHVVDKYLIPQNNAENNNFLSMTQNVCLFKTSSFLDKMKSRNGDATVQDDY